MTFPSGGVGFNNPITSAGALVIPSLHSPNYGVNPDGTFSGWAINADGTAFFYNVSLGSDLYGIDSATGVASFQDLHVLSGDIDLDGSLLIGDILAGYSQGMIARTTINADSNTYSDAIEHPIRELRADIVSGRSYRIAFDPFIILGSVAGDIWTIRIRFTHDGSAPGITSDQLQLGAMKVNVSASQQNSPVGYVTTIIVDDSQVPDWFLTFNTASLRLLLTIQRTTGTGTGRIFTGAGTVNPMTLSVFDLGSIPVDTGVNRETTSSPVVGLNTYVHTYNATWGASYRGSGATCGATDSRFNQNGSLYQGRYDGCNANTKSLIGFDYATIQSDLSGATVNKCEVFLYYNHWYFNSGGTAVIGTHNNSFTGTGDTGPSSPTGTTFNRKQVANWPKPGGKWVDLGTTIGNEFKAGTTKGIMLGEGPSTNLLYYGHANDANSSNQPKMRFTYTK